MTSPDSNKYNEIAQYFSASEFKELADLEKLALLNKKLNYERCLEIGLTVKMPLFMENKENVKPKAKRRLPATGQDTENVPKRRSSRVRNKEQGSKVIHLVEEPSLIRQLSNQESRTPVASSTDHYNLASTSCTINQSGIESEKGKSKQTQHEKEKTQGASGAQHNSLCALDIFEATPNVLDENQVVADPSDAEPYPKLKLFFPKAEWARMNNCAKRHLQTSLDEYEDKIQNGSDATPPAFMSKALNRDSTTFCNENELSMNPIPSLNESAMVVGSGSEVIHLVEEPSAIRQQKESRTPPVASSTDHYNIASPLCTINQTEPGEEQWKSKKYFTPTEWEKLSALARRIAEDNYETWENAKREGFHVQPPMFMKRNEGCEAQSFSQSVDSEHSLVNRSLSLVSHSPALICKSTDLIGMTSRSNSGWLSEEEERNEKEHSTMGGSPSGSSSFLSQSRFDNDNVRLTPESHLKTLLQRPRALAGTLNITSRIPSIPCIQERERCNMQQNDADNGDSWPESSINCSSRLSAIQTTVGSQGGSSASKARPQGTTVKSTTHCKKLPLMREITPNLSIASRPDIAYTRTVVPGMQFEFEIDWSKMNNTLLTALAEQRTPTKTDRDHMVLMISTDLKNKYDEVKASTSTLKQKTPGRRSYKAITTKIFENYRNCFEDIIRDKVVGDGMFSLCDQIETCTENKYRNKLPSSQRTLPGKGNRKAACILPHKYSPPLSKEDATKAESLRRQLRAMYIGRKTEWDWTYIKKTMLEPCSFAAQRKMIVGKDRNTEDIVEKWPFLFEFWGLMCHVDDLTGQPILNNFQRFILDDLDDVALYLTVQSHMRIANIKIDRAVKASHGIHKKFLGVVAMLASHFGEAFDRLVLAGTNTIQPQDVGELQLPATPCLVALGTPFYTDKFFLCIDRQCVGTLNSGLEAIAALCSTYFIFGIFYPPGAGVTMTYIERVMANLSDADGLSKAQTPTGVAARSALQKIQKVCKEIDDFKLAMASD